VARYILDLEDGADENTDVLLMFIGDGEAGKTSTLLALKNTESNTARPIGVDDRTIGIDISEFTPYPDAPLRFSAWDFGGQAVYAIMQQLFMSRRALYPLLWRVRESLDISRFDPAIKCDVCKRTLVASQGHQQPVYRVKGQGLCHAECASYDTLINSWTERLQFRVPGVTVVLVATHIDCATSEQVEEQCKNVAAVAQRIIERHGGGHPAAEDPQRRSVSASEQRVGGGRGPSEAAAATGTIHNLQSVPSNLHHIYHLYKHATLLQP
jgi:GTPase SAR1 family protein